jgi:hypothetical protein
MSRKIWKLYLRDVVGPALRAMSHEQRYRRRWAL